MKEIDIDNFDDLLRETKPRVTFVVPNTIGHSASLEVDITFESLDDFSPTVVARNVGGLGTLLEKRAQLSNLMTYMDGKSGTELVVEQLLNDRKLLTKIATAGQSSFEDEQAELIRHLNDFELGQEGQSAESFLELLAREFKPKTDGARLQVKKALRTLAEQAFSDLDAFSEITP